MNRLKTIVLFAGIFAIGLGAVSLNDSSATSLSILAGTPQTQNVVSMLGHVEYKIMDSEGQIIKYAQGDNTVVHAGMDCVSRLVFENSTGTVCGEGNNEFQFIAIGNGSAAVDPPVNTNTELITTSAGNCASSSVDGEMARKQVTPSFTAATGSTGTVVVLDTVNDPFDFGVSNATSNITQSGVFNGPELTTDNERQCTGAIGTASMFAIQNLATTTGISVSAGDSLSVKWTITVG